MRLPATDSDQAWPDTRQPRSPASSKLLLLLGVLIIAACVAVGAVVSRRDERGSGDPHGRILHALEGPIHAPAGTTTTFRQEAEPRWDSCDGRPGTFGWNDVADQVWFSTSMSQAAVEGAVDGQLRAEGWSPAGVDTWTTVAAGSTARATLSLSPKGDHWELMALARPVGRSASGC